MRNTFATKLCEYARKDQRVFLITGDLGYSVLEPFANEFPDRFLNIGIAEQNMTGVAAGLAKEGFKVFTYSIGNFPTLRCLEQIRYDVCYHNLDVKIVAVGAGYAYGSLGVSHHTTEDIGVMRSLPNMTVASPADAREVEAILDFFMVTDGPGYLRINKNGEPIIHDDQLLDLNMPIKILDGNTKLILGTGAITHSLIETCKNNRWSLWSFPIISLTDDSWINESLLGYDEIVTVEEHQLNCGFGSSIIEKISDRYYLGYLSHFPKIKRLGIDNKFVGFSGSQETLRKTSGLYL